MSGIDPRRHLLSEEDSRRVFLESIVAKELGGASPVDQPTVLFVAGQPGAGKTRTTQAVVDTLASRGGSVVVNSDYYKPHHPRYRRLLEEDDRTAAPYTSLDGRRWMAQAEEWLIQRRMNVVIETTMRDPGDFAEPARMFRDAGYRAEAAILAVPEAQSRLGIVSRYHEQVTAAGHGRLTETANHDASYIGVLAAARAIDEGGLVDAVAVYRRGNVLLHENSGDDRTGWRHPAEAAATTAQERGRPFTQHEGQAFLTEVRRLHLAMGGSWRPALQEITELARPLIPPGAEAAVLAAASFPQPLRAAVPLRSDPGRAAPQRGGGKDQSPDRGR